MTVREVLQRGRDRAEALMLDTGQALRPTGDTVYDGDRDVTTYTPLFADSPAKIQEAASRTQEVGGRTSVRVGMELHLPATTPALTVGDVFEFTACDPMSLMAPGDRVRIAEPVTGTLRTARRYHVERVVT